MENFQPHIVEQHKSYRMVAESWESVQANLNVPLFTWGTFVADGLHKNDCHVAHECLQTTGPEPLDSRIVAPSFWSLFLSHSKNMRIRFVIPLPSMSFPIAPRIGVSAKSGNVPKLSTLMTFNVLVGVIFGRVVAVVALIAFAAGLFSLSSSPAHH